MDAICPECEQGKHDNCDGRAWDPVKDDETTCACYLMDHRHLEGG